MGNRLFSSLGAHKEHKDHKQLVEENQEDKDLTMLKSINLEIQIDILFQAKKFKTSMNENFTLSPVENSQKLAQDILRGLEKYCLKKYGKDYDFDIQILVQDPIHGNVVTIRNVQYDVYLNIIIPQMKIVALD